MKSAKHLVVLSVDGLASSDLRIVEELPHFRDILESGSIIKELESVYPSQTYPTHATFVTGCYPHKHGIMSNTRVQPGRKSPDWYWYSRDKLSPSLYDIAHRAGLSVTIIFWPVAAGARVDYHVPEIKPGRVWQNPLLLLLKNGTPLYIVDLMFRYGRFLKEFNFTNIDNFSAEASSFTIERKKPNLLLVHLMDLDHQRHSHGLDSPEAERTICQMDERLGKIIRASKKAGTYDETAFIILGDHGYKDVHCGINLHTAFREAGLLSLNRMGRLKDWKVWPHSCQGSAQIYLRDRTDTALRNQVRNILLSLTRGDTPPLKIVFEGDQISDLKLGGGIDFIAEASPGYFIASKMEGPLLEKMKEGARAAHGYLPDQDGYRALLLATGAGIRRKNSVPFARAVDIGPTLAAILGLDMPEAEGRVLHELLHAAGSP